MILVFLKSLFMKGLNETVEIDSIPTVKPRLKPEKISA